MIWLCSLLLVLFGLAIMPTSILFGVIAVGSGMALFRNDSITEDRAIGCLMVLGGLGALAQVIVWLVQKLGH